MASSAVRLPVLDLLRGIAILVVFGFHYFGIRNGWDFYRWDGPWRNPYVLGWDNDWLLYPITWGWTGVPLFFVLSGFVIHYQSIARPTFSTVSFLQRRLWRIVPAYYVAIAVWGYHYWVTPFEWSGQWQYLSHALFIHNLFPTTFFGISGAFWSLGSEMQFYLAYPLVIWLRPKIGMKNILLGAIALSLVTRGVLSIWFECGYPISVIWATFPVLWMDWLLGAWVAERLQQGKRVFPGRGWLIGSFTLFFLAGLWKPSNCLSFSLASLFWAVLLEKWVRRDWQPSRLGRIGCQIGVVSYSMYLWHDPMIESITWWLNARRDYLPVGDGMFRVISFVYISSWIWIVSTLSYKIVEDPRWLWRWYFEREKRQLEPASSPDRSATPPSPGNG